MSKKKWRIKTLEELRATKGVEETSRDIIHKESKWNFLIDLMSHLHNKEFEHDFKKRSFLIGAYSVHKWMCKKVKDSEFKQGEIVKVKDFGDTIWTKREYVCKYKGLHIALNSEKTNVVKWDEVKKC